MPHANRSDGQPTASLARALDLARQNPGDGASWAEAEALAVGRDDSGAVAEAYRAALNQDHLQGAWVLELGERAVRFHREWCAEEPDALIAVLERLIALEPEADWPLRQLIVALTLREDWDRLLANYDRALVATADKGRRAELLAEAAQVAKDFLGSAERAVAYLRPLFALRPQDAQVVASLERLLEKLERWADLVEVWTLRIGEVPADEAAALRVKIADVLHERLRAHRAALDALAPLRSQRRHLALGVRRLGALVGDVNATAEVRRDAVRWLAAHHDDVGSPDDALAVVLEGLGFVAGADRAQLLAEAARRFVAAGREREATHQLASLLPLVPADRAVEDELLRLASRTGLQRLAVGALLDASASAVEGRERVRLVLRAAAELEDVLQERDEVVALYDRVTRDEAATTADRAHAYGRLEAIWEVTGKAELRLGALTALVGLVDRPSERRAWLGVAAKLAFTLGDWERAVGLWRRILEADGRDREALDGQVAALSAARRFPELSAALRQRCTASEDPREQAADLARAAEVEAHHRRELAAADELWRERDERFGPSEEGVDARADLLAETGRVQDLASVLAQDTARERARAAAAGVRLGKTLAGPLATPAQAVGAFRRALEAEPTEPGAREGLWALVREGAPEVCKEAVAALMAAALRLDDRVLLRALVEPRVAVAESPLEMSRLWADGGMRAERDGADLPEALRCWARALVIAPHDPVAEGEVVRLAAATGQHAQAVAALREGAAVLPRDERRRVGLLARAAELAEEHLADVAGATRDRLEALSVEPGRLDLRRGVIRSGVRAGAVADVAGVLLGAEVPDAVRFAVLFPEAEVEAKAGHKMAGLAAALIALLPSLTESLGGAASAAVEVAIAGWFENDLDDAAAAEKALRRALVFAPDAVVARERLASLERRHPDAGLFETLVALGEGRPGDLDAWVEALEVAEALPGAQGADRRGKLAGRLFERAARLLAVGEAPSGSRDAVSIAASAGRTHVSWLLATGDRADAARAVALCRTASALPLGPDVVRSFSRRAAEIAATRLGLPAEAIVALSAVLGAHPDDAETIADLGRLYFQEERWAELFALRRHELDRTPLGGEGGERRLLLRLDMEELGGRIETVSERLALLRVNLAESPGHGPTLEAMTALLTGRQQHGLLVELLESEAQTLEGLGEAVRAAEIWTRAARWAEAALADKKRAAADHERAVKLVAAPATLDDLGRLCMDADVNEPEAAARWLDKLLPAVELPARPAVAMRLARAYLAADRRHRAVAALARTLDEVPSSRPLRAMLAELHRAAGAHEALARLICDGSAFVEDGAEMVALAREARDLCQKVGLPALAVEALRRAHEVAPEDHEMALAYGRALAAAGTLDGAIAVFKTLLETTRRATERSALFFEIGKVEEARGALEVALASYEQASAIDGENAPVLLALAGVAERSRHFDRAERALRALMLIVRRPEKSGTAVTPADVLLALHAVTVASGQTERAREILDSALEAAVQEPAALARLRERLEASGDLETLARVLTKRAGTVGEVAAEAATLRELAEVQSRLGDGEAALTTMLKAVRLVPADEGLHRRAREMARGLQDGLGRYLTTLEAFVEQRRRREDIGVVARLLLWAGQIAEEDRGDLPQALAYYQRAADASDVAPEALARAAHVARGLDPGARRALLEKLQRLARHAATPIEKADLLFRLAEAQLEEPTTRDAGLGSLSAALDETSDVQRALALVARADIRDDELPRILPLYERTARERGDERLLLDCLLRRARGAHPRPDFLREGYDLAVALSDDAAAEEMLAVLASLGRQLAGADADASWAGTERARRQRARGDLRGAYASLAAALEIAESPQTLAALSELGQQLVDASAQDPDKAALGAQVLESVRVRQGDDPTLVEALLSLYERIPDRLGYERLMRDKLERAMTPAERNPLRLRLAAFMASSEPDDPLVIDLLQDVLLEAPGHGEAATLLADALERRGDLHRLESLLVQQLGEAEARSDRATVVALVKRLVPVVQDERPDEAVDLLRRALDAEPGTPDLVRALLSLIPGADAARVESIDRILDAQPDAADLVPLRQAAYEKAELWESLARLHERLADRESDPRRAVALLRASAGVHRIKLYDAESAAEVLRRARAVRPSDGLVARDLLTCLVELGRPSEAITAGRLALRQLSPDTDLEVKLGLLHAVGDLLTEQGRLAEAISIFQDALAMAPPALQAEFEAILVRLKRKHEPPAVSEDTSPGDAIPIDEILTEITNEELA